MNTNVVDFYCYEGTDPYGRTIEDMIAMTDGQLEASHDVIQWMFPLHEASNYNPDCPIVDQESAKILQNNPTAQKRMNEALLRFVRFLGFLCEDGKFGYDPNGERNRQNWRTKHNHNLLRITRVIRSLRLFGLEKEAEMFWDTVYQSAMDIGCVSENTAKYWNLALRDELFETLRK